MKLAWAFFKRDAMIALSYRLDFVFQVLGRLVLIIIFYFIVKSISGVRDLSPAGFQGGLFAYILVGIAFADCISISMTVFAKQIREGQVTGSLEVTLLAPVPLSVILLCSSLWAYAFSGARFLFYLVVGWLFLGVDLSRANWGSVLVVLLLTDLCFMGVGVLMASGVVTFKRGDTATTLLSDLMMFGSGAFFPISTFPAWVQKISNAIPFTPALECMRRALLKGSGIGELSPRLAVLSAFTVVCIVAGFSCFTLAVNAAKRNGTLSEF
jgi:ABC-2 type transport system permease protein